jgi:preprotein translocase subunit SecF
VLILAGLLVIWRLGMPLGVKFSGGSIVFVKPYRPPDIPQVRAALDRSLPGVGQNALVQRYGDATANQVMIRVPAVGAESGGSLSQTADSVAAAPRREHQQPQVSAPRSS